jgi:signal transduction histidine kinase/DNA-binding response OmpR family regulator
MSEETSKIAENEKNRIQALTSYQILDTPPEPHYDMITNLASTICNAPICYISFIDDSRVWFKSKIGLTLTELPRIKSFCQYVLPKNDLLQITDFTKHDMFKEHPYVTGPPNVRFYAGMPLRTPNGYNIGALCIIDTKPRELNKIEEGALAIMAKQVVMNLEMRLMNLQLQKASLAKTDFLSNMSHEIRTPMNAIAGFTDLLLSTKLNEEQAKMLTIIKNSTELLISIINEILDYSKIESGKLSLEAETFDLKESIYLIYDLLKIRTSLKDIEFEVLLDSDLPKFVIGDKTRLSQILTNLIGNAIKFTNRGDVKLKVQIINKTTEINEIKFSVTDTGIGIAEDKLSKIFERFEQADKSTFGKFGGTGLGLNITKSLVELYGGVLRVESTLGKGSNFNFTIKFQIPKIQEIDLMGMKTMFSKRDNNNKPTLDGKKILLAEDTEVNVKLVKKIFENKNIILDVAENGKICIDKVKAGKYDLILMDLQMPVMDGFEATEYIRKELKRDIPIIAVTANACIREKQRCLHLKMNDYLTKPFKSEDLISAILKHLTKPKNFHTNLPSKLKLKKVHIRNSSFYKHNFDSFKIDPSKERSISRSPLAPISTNKKEELIKKRTIFQENVNRKINYESVKVDCIKEFCEDKDFEKSLIQQYLKDFPTYLNTLRKSIITKSFVEIKNISHKMKSSVVFFGLNETRKQLALIEKYAAMNDINSIISIYKECKVSLDESIKFLSNVANMC